VTEIASEKKQIKFIACDFDSEKDKRNIQNIASVTNLLAEVLWLTSKGGQWRGEHC